MEIQCPSCKEEILIADEDLKEQLECPFCQQVFTIELEKPPIVEKNKSINKTISANPIYEYKAVPFLAMNENHLNTQDMAMQLTSQINNQAADGWEFVQHADVQVQVNPGCLNFLSKPTIHHINQLIFRRATK